MKACACGAPLVGLAMAAKRCAATPATPATPTTPPGCRPSHPSHPDHANHAAWVQAVVLVFAGRWATRPRPGAAALPAVPVDAVPAVLFFAAPDLPAGQS